MEIRPCWLPTTVYLHLKSLSLGQIPQCRRPSRVLSFVCVVLVLCIFVLMSHAFVVWRPWFTVYTESHNGDLISLQKRKWTGGNYDTRNSAQYWDFSDPVLVDVPRDVIRTTAESRSDADIIAEERDISYGIVIDCGSSGSRVFIYYWPKHSGKDTELLNIRQLTRDGHPIVKKITPGIATLVNRPFQVKPYLTPLLDYASHHIPAEKQKETPLYVLCTAGMRMVTKRHQASLLEQVQLTIQTKSNFQFYSSHAEVISGMTEGLYFWMGLNYALGNLHQAHLTETVTQSAIKNLHQRAPTVGVIDMGGGSLQIAFEVGKYEKQNFSKNVMDINLGCIEHKYDHEYNVFVDTFLHKGGNAVRETYERDLVMSSSSSNSAFSPFIVEDPCLPLGFIQKVTHKPTDGLEKVVTVNGTGDFNLCRERIISYLDKSDCYGNSRTCIINGRQMPLINYERDNFFGSSEFFYCMDDVLHIGGAYNKSQYETKVQEYCATPWNVTWQRYSDGYYEYADANRIKFQCFKAAWVSVVLHEGLNFPTSYEHLTTVKYINKSEIQWTLGAILYKTRYLPLHEIQLHFQAKNEKRVSHWNTMLYPFHLLAHSGVFLFVCIVIALAYLLILLVRFCIHTDKQKVATLRRVRSSMAYLVNEEV